MREPCQVCSGILSFSIKLCGLHCSFVKFGGSLNAIHCFCVVWSQRLVFFRHNVFGPPNDLMVLLFILSFFNNSQGMARRPLNTKIPTIFLEYAGELHIFVLRRRKGPITVKPYHTLDQSEGGVEKTLKGLLHIKTDT